MSEDQDPPREGEALRPVRTAPACPFLPAEARPDVTTDLARNAWQLAQALHALRAAEGAESGVRGDDPGSRPAG